MCFYCQRAADPEPTRLPGTRTRLPEPGPMAPVPSQRVVDLQPSEPVQELQMEVIWGRHHRLIAILPGGATIGSTTEADVVVPAPFLAPGMPAYLARGHLDG